jgi:hypothetical protein
VSLESASVQLQEQCRISYGLSCGCNVAKSNPVKHLEANLIPGGVVICDRHDEYAVVIRVSAYLDDIRGATVRLLQANDVDRTTAECIAAEQAR